jgi:hypothetical protein
MSRLLNNSEGFRSTLLGRNLYSPNSEYDINNPELINIINRISNEIVNPGNSFDFTNTIFGRVIGPQTPITIIGRNELFKQKAYEVKSIIRTKTIPTIKLNRNFSGFKDIISIDKNVDYTITKDADLTPLEKFKQVITDITSLSPTINPLAKDLSPIDNYIWNNNLLYFNLGDGQQFELRRNLSMNQFHPNYDGIDTQYSLANKFDLYTNQNSFSTLKNIFNISNINLLPQPLPINTNGLPVIEYSNELYKNENLISFNGVSTSENIQDISDKINNTELNSSYGLSNYTKNIIAQLGNKASMNKKLPIILDNQGNQHFNGSVFKQNTSDDPYGYNKLNGVINKNIGNANDKSVLHKSIKPKIVGNGDSNVMFSIENLATTYNSYLYPDEQRGRYGGRFMWFNPFIMNINETSNPEFNSTKFIGRSEPVYTFAGNERTLTMSFKLLVDYDKELLNISDYHSFTRYVSTNKKSSNRNQPDKANTDLKIETEIKKIRDELTKDEYLFIYTGGFIVYQFENNNYFLDANDITYRSNILNIIDQLINYYDINENARFKIFIESYSSINSDTNFDIELSKLRGYAMSSSIIDIINEDRPDKNDIINKIIFDWDFGINEVQSTPVINYSSQIAQSERNGVISNIELISSSVFNKELSNKDLNVIKSLNEENKNFVDNTINNVTNVEQIIENRLSNDYSLLSVSSFSAIKNNVIAPGLISHTAKDLYNRLTFLNQCTRQGVTIDNQNTISNSVFGKPPVLVLRIGDMYFTKAILSQLTIDFTEENGWDLNTNGNGVQFMGCDINLSFKLIGGSSIDGPTKNILNADDRSFYANSSFEENKFGKFVDREQQIIDENK